MPTQGFLDTEDGSSEGSALLSVIIPSRGRKAELEMCLDFLDEQTDTPDEVIVIAHREDSETLTFLSEYSRKVDWLAYATTDGGVCKARNLGISLAKGDILAFLDDDIILPSTYIESLKRVFNRDSVDIVTGYVFDKKDLSNPLYIRKGDIDFINHTADTTFSNRIKRTMGAEKDLRYRASSFLAWSAMNAIKSIFLLESPRKGRILASGYRSGMPCINSTGRLTLVEWLQGGNFAARRRVFDILNFDESLETMKYAPNEDLVFSARVGKLFKIHLSTEFYLFHTRAQGGIRINRNERLRALLLTSRQIAIIRGSNPVAPVWAGIGLAIIGSFWDGGLIKPEAPIRESIGVLAFLIQREPEEMVR